MYCVGDMSSFTHFIAWFMMPTQIVVKGVDGVWVSNHGGRQLDTVPATIEVLPEVWIIGANNTFHFHRLLA